MEFAKTIMLTLSVLLTAAWLGVVYKAEGADKVKEACHPISMTVEAVTKVSIALTGLYPEWTVRVHKVLYGGCFYFFSSMFSGSDVDIAAEGGVSKE